MSERKPFHFKIYRSLRSIGWADHIMLESVGSFYQGDTKLRSVRVILRNNLETMAHVRATHGHDWKEKP